MERAQKKFIILISLLCLFAVIFMYFLAPFEHNGNPIVSAGAFLLFSLAALWIMLSLKIPFREFQLRINVSAKEWKVTLLSALFICLGLLLVKFLAVEIFFVGSPIFDTDQLFSQDSTDVVIYCMLLYLIFCPVQVFIVNVATQNVLLYLFANKKYIHVISIVCSTLLFAAFHLVINWLLAVFMLFFGLYWSILFYRHRSVLTIAVSHMIIGTFGFYCLGYLKLLNQILLLVQ